MLYRPVVCGFVSSDMTRLSRPGIIIWFGCLRGRRLYPTRDLIPRSHENQRFQYFFSSEAFNIISGGREDAITVLW